MAWNPFKFIEILPSDLASRTIEQLVEFDGWLRAFEKSEVVAAKIEELNQVKSLGKKGA